MLATKSIVCRVVPVSENNEEDELTITTNVDMINDSLKYICGVEAPFYTMMNQKYYIHDML